MNQPQDSDEPQPNPPDIYVRPWMLPYLPKDEGPRDFVMVLAGIMLVVACSQTAFLFDLNLLGVTTNCLGLAYVVSRYWGRYGVRDRFRRHQKRKLGGKNLHNGPLR
jgi:hypothetical protein